MAVTSAEALRLLIGQNCETSHCAHSAILPLRESVLPLQALDSPRLVRILPKCANNRSLPVLAHTNRTTARTLLYSTNMSRIQLFID